MEKKASCVLIVDDMMVNRTILSSLLSSHGVNSDLATSGKEAIYLCRKNDYDLVLLDHRMPEVDGVETMLEIKSIFKKKGLEVPIICHTTDEASWYESLYKAAGFSAILTKPIDPHQLYEALITYLPEGSLPAVQDEAAEDKAHVRQEEALLPDWLRAIPEIDTMSGIEHCDTAEDYLETLYIFISSIREKASEIEKFYHDSNWQMFTLRIHSIKSVARLVGANSLADTAAALEEAAKHLDRDIIDDMTPGFLRSYRAFYDKLSAMPDIHEEHHDASVHTHLPGISQATLDDAFMTMAEFVTLYDSENIRVILDSLMGYDLPHDVREKLLSIDRALHNFDWARLREIFEITGGEL